MKVIGSGSSSSEKPALKVLPRASILALASSLGIPRKEVPKADATPLNLSEELHNHVNVPALRAALNRRKLSTADSVKVRLARLQDDELKALND